MRPTDENQAASTRPNLMSSRRGSGEDNILAMLEREGARRGAGRTSPLRLASYGAGAALCGVLVGGLAWLAYDNRPTMDNLQARVDPPAAAESAKGRVQPAGALAAVIVDEQPRMRTAPPLVMLPPQDAPVRPAAPSTPATRPAPAMPAAAPVDAARVAADKRTAKPVHVKSPEPKPAARRALVARAGAAVSASVAALRLRKAPASPSADPQVDGDVALISAIIAQSERHRSERDEAPACAGAKCALKPARP